MRRMITLSGTIRSNASIIPTMIRHNRIDTEHRGLFRIPANRYPVLARQNTTVELPEYLQWQIALRDSAHQRHRIFRIESLLAEFERRNLRRY
jgi:hypothetical protein